MSVRVCLWLFTLLALGGFAQPANHAHTQPNLILISLDGWRWDYLDRFNPPALAKLAARGVRAEGLIPVFPSKTFPNHYTIVTGLPPLQHGIISNNMEDPVIPGRFTLSNREVQADPRWWGGEPIWNTAERQGLLSAPLFWPGSEIEIGGRRPSFWRPYDGDLPNSERVAQLIRWLQLPESRRPAFLTLYFADVDVAGHDHGPDSREVREAALALDAELARLVDGVEEAGLAGSTHFVVVSDHGMADLDDERIIFLDDYLDPATVDVIDWTPVLGIAPRARSVDSLYAELHGRHPALKVYRREELPEQYRLRGQPRLAPVIGIADDGWTITTREARAKWKGPPGGNHGYDPVHQSMQGLFVAAGPRFKQGMVARPFENLHLYELMCEVLGIEPAPNKGSLDAVRDLLTPATP